MSLEQSIADLQTQAGLLLDLPQNIANTAQAQVTAVGNAYQNHLNTLTTNFRVNQLTGSDNNSGNEGSPFKTINRAVDLTPKGGACFVYLEEDYHVDQEIMVDGKFIQIASVDTLRRLLSLEREVRRIGSTDYRNAIGFDFLTNGQLVLRSLKILMPALDGVWGQYPIYNFSPPIQYDWPTSAIDIHLVDCHLERPAASFSALLSGAMLLRLMVSGATETDQPMLGWWSDQQTDTNGADPKTRTNILTNLPSF